jgi:ABC-type branched-subunit amino acid transport system substrate-binding protein
MQLNKSIAASNRKKWLFGGILLLLIAVTLALPFAYLWWTNSLHLSDGLGVVAYNGEYVGVNDGGYHPFDMQRQDPQNLRQKAINALQASNSSMAMSLWSQYLSGDNTNDAEIYIYRENQQILVFPHVTLIVGLDFPELDQTPGALAATRSALQGAYLAQREFNDQHGNIKLRLLLANTGNSNTYVAPVAQQIAHIVRQDKTVVGILGWQTSAHTVNILRALQQTETNLPMVSQSASSDYLEGISPYFFTIVPPNSEEARTASLLIRKLHATKTIVFMDPSDLYSQNLGQDFEQLFPSYIEEDFTTNQTNTATFSTKLKDALNQVHDTNHLVAFFAGATAYDTVQFQNALGGYPAFPVIAGDSGYLNLKPSYGRWYIISLAFHDEWAALTGKNAPFFQEYRSEFDPSKQHPGGYGDEIPDARAIVSYDAARVLSQGIDNALLKKGTINPTSQDLEKALIQIQGPQAWQGLSGLISFDTTQHVPTNKALIVLQIDAHGDFQMVCMLGTFSKRANNSIPAC